MKESEIKNVSRINGILFGVIFKNVVQGIGL